MYNIIKFGTLDSTNNYAKKNIEKFLDKTVISAEIQTMGHGRFQRKWISDVPENIYCSIILKPENKKHAANLTQYMCVVLCKTLEKYKINPEIKWANDILINSKKISGILCENVNKKGIILGVGINLNFEKETLEKITQPATALNIETGQKINKEEFQKKLLDHFFENYELFMQQGFTFIKIDYLQRTKFIGKKIYISSENNKKTEYIAKSINDDGSLLVTDNQKKEIILYSGDLSF